ncbi:MAG: DUF3990 domain-containing protein [Lachnospiraceae bacterium]|nr:DUF3990 domain-containing protein [Lachnospiraceae bacterium]
MQLYHGSNVCVENPRILTNGHYKDFGFGFYCTNYEHQAKKWALTRKKNHICTEKALGALRYERSYQV